MRQTRRSWLDCRKAPQVVANCRQCRKSPNFVANCRKGSQIVAADEPRLYSPGARVRNLRPDRAGEQDGVEADAAVRRGDRLPAQLAPRLDDAVDRPWIEIGTVGEYDDRRIGVERGQSAAE